MKTVTVPTWKSILYNVVSFIFSPFTKTQKKVYVLDDTREEVEVPFEETTMTSTFSEIREQIAGLQKVKVEKLDDFEKLDVFYQQVNQLSERITFIGTSSSYKLSAYDNHIQMQLARDIGYILDTITSQKGKLERTPYVNPFTKK